MTFKNPAQFLRIRVNILRNYVTLNLYMAYIGANPSCFFYKASSITQDATDSLSHTFYA